MVMQDEVTTALKLSQRNFENFIQDRQTRVFTWEISHGFSWTRTTEERSMFEEGLDNFMREMQIQKDNFR
ncbi:hypothetical protein SUGI_1025950 [Cryptomeria japonica]|nr:hypothetical protein SUGI_1025950 [Cryptomeria japonica]